MPRRPKFKFKFKPSGSYGSDIEFVVMNRDTIDDDIMVLKRKLENEITVFIPARYRKYVKRFVEYRKAPEKSVIGWRYR